MTPPKQVEIAWARQKLLARQPGMYLADAGAARHRRRFLHRQRSIPAKSEMLFTGSGHSFAELSALADASKPLPRFALAFRLKASIAANAQPGAPRPISWPSWKAAIPS